MLTSLFFLERLPRIIIFTFFFLLSQSGWTSPSIEGIQTYQRNIHLLQYKKKLAADILYYRQAGNLWDILRRHFILSGYENHPAVKEKIAWYLHNQEFLKNSAQSAAPYLYYIAQQVYKRHLPAELVLLPIIESGYNPFVYSNVGAAGIWQMMPQTASGFGIQQTGWYDGRRDVIASTRAALNYLAYLQNFFEGNWLLALAAYNTGEGNVLAAIRKNIRHGKTISFWELPLAQQTKDYVPRLLALAAIIRHPERYSIHFSPVPNAPYLAQVNVGTQINLKTAATLAGISHYKIKQLNPGFTYTITSTKKPYSLILPIENVEQFTKNFSLLPSSNPTRWLRYVRQRETQPPLTARIVQPGDTIYMVRARDSLESIARRFHISSAMLHAANPWHHKTLKIGQKLIVPTHVRTRSVTPLLAHNEVTPGDTVYIVRKYDTMQKIAQKFGTTSSHIRLANLLENNKMKEGDVLIIPSHHLR